MGATIKDVADYAHVAVSTVSRVINNKDRVSPETRKAVLEAIEKLGYVRNNLAASMKTGETRFIVAVVPDIRNEFYTSVIRGIEAVASTRGYYTLVYTTGETYSKELAVFEGEFSHLVDGIILTPSQADYALYQRRGKPTVIIDREIPGSDMYSVCVDNYKGAALLMNELLEYGHKKIAIITGPLVFNIGIDRMQGYLDMLESHNIPVRQEYICVGDWFEEDGYRLTEQLLQLEDPPTAIFAANNLICIGCAECLCDRGLTIGTDISLVGFDDSVVARYLRPGITGIKRAMNEMGELGAEMLLSLLSGHPEDISKKKMVLDVELVRRHSIAKIE
ncbi:LacI family transcriptional regulator [Blautia schinkii]|nr:LacI family transcriptional regulator [Blautia schinkii]